MLLQKGRVAAYATVLAFTLVLSPVNSQVPTPAALSVVQILESMQRHNQSQKDGLKHYHAVRHYEAEYRGFATTIAAKMEVDVTYDASSGKTFRIVSQSGSKLLYEKVLKRAVQSEEEAAKDPAATALSPANYRFAIEGSETLEGRPAYILRVEPLTESKFLYRGKIWVDAADFALVKFEATPAKNPSFWISRTLIRYSNKKIGDFWLPQLSHSDTKVRIGGTAMLTIDYGTYQILPDGTSRKGGSTATIEPQIVRWREHL